MYPAIADAVHDDLGWSREMHDEVDWDQCVELSRLRSSAGEAVEDERGARRVRVRVPALVGGEGRRDVGVGFCEGIGM